MRRNVILTILLNLVAFHATAQDCLQYADDYPGLAPTGPRLHDQGDSQAVAVSGATLALATDTCLQFFDITDPLVPVYLSEVPVWAEHLAAVDDVIYAAKDGYGVQAIDISDPTAPSITATFVNASGCMDMLVHGDHLYLMPSLWAFDAWFGVIIFDISVPTAPELVGEVEGGAGFSIAMHGDVMMLANYDPYYGNVSYLGAADMSDPEQPVYLDGWLNFAGRTQDIAVHGHHLYAITDTHGLYVIDVTDPSVPFIVHEETALAGGSGVAVVDGTLVVMLDGGTAGQAVTLSLADPAHPVMLDGAPVQGSHAGHTHADGWLYIANDTQVPSLVDLRQPSLPVGHDWSGFAPGHVDLTSEGIALAGATLYVGSRRGDALRVVDLSDPQMPTVVASLWTNLVGGDVAVEDTLLFQMMKKPDQPGERWLDVYSIAEPHAPQRLSRTSLGVFTLNLATTPGAVYSTLNGMIHVVDVKNPYAPVHVQTLNPPGNGNGRDLHVHDGFLLAPLTSSGLVIYDISDPVDPHLAAVVELPYCVDVSVVGDRAYATDYYDGLVVIDMADPTSPVILARNPEIGPNQRLLYHDDALYVTDYELGGWVFDPLGDPLAPEPVGRFFFPSSVMELQAHGPWVILSEGDRGVQFVWRACPVVTGIAGPVPGAANRPRVVPNPFNPMTSIRYTVTQAGPVEVAVFDLSGCRVRTLVSGWGEVGQRSATWDGRWACGRPASSGSYVVRVVQTDGESAAKAVLIR